MTGYKTCRYCNTPHVLSSVKCMYCDEPFKRDLKTRLWNFVTRMDNRRVVKVKSLWPEWDEHHGALAWPRLLVDTESGQRSTVTPIWTRPRYAFWRKT